ncbi:MAG: hypothetical protein M3N16_01940 [Actinomycetota bacterium]|nr:hypothetical protein [Actinomycetota bacterium]
MSTLSRLKRVALPLAGLMLLSATTATGAFAQAPGLPRTYDVQRIDTPEPVCGEADPARCLPPATPTASLNFGWGMSSADLTGDGKLELLVSQSQSNVPGAVFIFDGGTGQPLPNGEIRPPERNFGGNDEELAFVYVEKLPDIGSCPGGAARELCPLPTVGPPDGRPEIIAGSRALRVDPSSPKDGDRDSGDPKTGRAYVFDGATRAVLKRIDMPVGDRQLQKRLGVAGGNAFGRIVMNPSGMPACRGPAAEGNNAGVAVCPSLPDAVRIGDVDGGGKPDFGIGVRGFRETGGGVTVDVNEDGTVDSKDVTAAPGSQCANSRAATCSSVGRAYVYRGEEIAGTDPKEILDGTVDGNETGSTSPETVTTIKNPFAQTSGSEFGGNIFRVGDVGRCTSATSCTTNPDGKPDVIVADRGINYPLASPSDELADVGASYAFDGTTGGRIFIYRHPEPQPRAEFAGGFNSGLAPGDLGNTEVPDVFHGAPVQNYRTTAEGRGYVLTQGVSRGLHFATLSDPTPNLGENFGASSTGVGELVGGPEAAANELLVAGYGPFNTNSDQVRRVIGDVHFFNPQSERALQTIPDPDGEQGRGSGFGMGITPMGDLNGDGFLDFAVSAYLSDAPGPCPPGSAPSCGSNQAGQGRAFIFRSNNSPAPVPPATAAPQPTSPRTLVAGACANETVGTDRGDTLNGTPAGDAMFGFGGGDVIAGFEADDCLDGGTGHDRLVGGGGDDQIRGRSGKDRLHGSEGKDQLYGEAGNDRLNGGTWNDLLAGGDGNDVLTGGGGADRLFGEDGNDAITAGSVGTKRIDAGRGNDKVNAANGRRDRVNCGAGRDVARVDRSDRVQRCERVYRARSRR